VARVSVAGRCSGPVADAAMNQWQRAVGGVTRRRQMLPSLPGVCWSGQAHCCQNI